MKHFFSYYVPPLLWAGVIFFFSSIPDFKSGLLPLWDLMLRKIVHMAEFGILGILVLRATQKKEKKMNIFFALIVSVFYAVSDEIHQRFVPGRTGSFIDVGIDAIGAVIGLWIYRRPQTPTRK